MIVIWGLAVSISVFADVYWIDSKASGRGSGSTQSPYVSFQEAAEKRGGGHTFIFKPGFYNTGQITLLPQLRGTSQSPTTLKSQYKYKAILHGAIYHNIYIKANCPWVIIDGFEISGARWSGVKTDSDYSVIRNCFIHNNSYDGIQAHNLTGTVIENNLIEFNGQHPHYLHGVYADGKKLVIRNNIVRGNSGLGIVLNPQISESKIYNNLIHKNGYYGLFWTSDSALGRNLVMNNTIVENVYGAGVNNPRNDIFVNNIVAFNFNDESTTKTAFVLWKDSEPNQVRIEGNILIPIEKQFNSKNTGQYPDFFNKSKGIFYLRDNSFAKDRGVTSFKPEKDFFGKEISDSNSMFIGCFPYSKALLKQDYQGKWHNGWPFYFKNEKNIIPDLWVAPGD
jgi:parallel beta-helix repeat protein